MSAGVSRSGESSRVQHVHQVDDPAFQGAGDLHQTREGDAVGAVLVLLHLLEGDVALLGERLLADAQALSSDPHGCP
jgi:hypothetical protein